VQALLIGIAKGLAPLPGFGAEPQERKKEAEKQERRLVLNNLFPNPNEYDFQGYSEEF